MRWTQPGPAASPPVGASVCGRSSSAARWGVAEVRQIEGLACLRHQPRAEREDREPGGVEAPGLPRSRL